MIVITTPTGNIGSQVLASLLDRPEPIRVIARDPGKLSPEVRRRVEIVEGSHADREVVMQAFEGADAVFWLVAGSPGASSANAAYVEFGRAGCEAFKARGVKHVVGISALGRGWPREAGNVSATLRLDDAIAATGVAYRALACSSLMENTLRQVVPIRDQGMFFGPAPPGLKLPHVATRDVAAVAARLLADRSWSGVEAIPLLGPEHLSFDDLAGIISEVLGKPVSFRQISLADLQAGMIGRGASEGMAQAMVEMMTAKNEGMDDMVPQPDPADTPTSFRQWAEGVL